MAYIPSGRYGQLTVTGDFIFKGDGRKRSKLWKTICDCGEVRFTAARILKSGKINSCGCLKHKFLKSGLQNKSHGGCPISGPSKEYTAWLNMKQRCTNPNASFFAKYGGRGIQICERWINSFETFVADMGPSPSPAHSLDRIDMNGNYEPANCRWADRKTQARNKSNYIPNFIREKIISLRGDGLTYDKIAELTGTSPASVRNIILGIY